MSVKEEEMNDIALNGIERVVMDEVKAFFSNPENEKKFQEWKRRRECEKKKTKRCSSQYGTT